jgi:hypothetical protein
LAKPLPYPVEGHIVIAGNHDMWHAWMVLQKRLYGFELVRFGALGEIAADHQHVRRHVMDGVV